MYRGFSKKEIEEMIGRFHNQYGKKNVFVSQQLGDLLDVGTEMMHGFDHDFLFVINNGETTHFDIPSKGVGGFSLEALARTVKNIRNDPTVLEVVGYGQFSLIPGVSRGEGINNDGDYLGIFFQSGDVPWLLVDIDTLGEIFPLLELPKIPWAQVFQTEYRETLHIRLELATTDELDVKEVVLTDTRFSESLKLSPSKDGDIDTSLLLQFLLESLDRLNGQIKVNYADDL